MCIFIKRLYNCVDNHTLYHISGHDFEKRCVNIDCYSCLCVFRRDGDLQATYNGDLPQRFAINLDCYSIASTVPHTTSPTIQSGKCDSTVGIFTPKFLFLLFYLKQLGRTQAKCRARVQSRTIFILFENISISLE